MEEHGITGLHLQMDTWMTGVIVHNAIIHFVDSSLLAKQYYVGTSPRNFRIAAAIEITWNLSVLDEVALIIGVASFQGSRLKRVHSNVKEGVR